MEDVHAFDGEIGWPFINGIARTFVKEKNLLQHLDLTMIILNVQKLKKKNKFNDCMVLK